MRNNMENGWGEGAGKGDTRPSKAKVEKPFLKDVRKPNDPHTYEMKPTHVVDGKIQYRNNVNSL